MEQLVKLVQEKTGLSEEMARMAVETVIGYLKTKMPAPMSGQIDALLQDGEGSADVSGAVAKGIGRIFGKG